MNDKLSEEFILSFFLNEVRRIGDLGCEGVHLGILKRIIEAKGGSGSTEWSGIDYDPATEDYIKGYVSLHLHVMPNADYHSFVDVHIPNKLFFEEFSKALINNRHNTVEEKEIIMGYLSIMGDDLGFTEEEKKNIWDKVKEF